MTRRTLRTAMGLGALLGAGCGGPEPAREARPRPAPRMAAPSTVSVTAARATPACTVPAVILPGQTEGAIPEHLLVETMRSLLVTFEACRQRRLAAHPALRAGRVVVRFVVDGDGSVCAAQVRENTTLDVPLADCVVQELRHQPFPPPTGGRAMIVFPIPLPAKHDAAGPSSSGVPL